MRTTKLLKIDPEQPDHAVLAEAAEIIKQGGLVAFPTETVYGLGANGLDNTAVHRIFCAKGRPADNPLILHIADNEAISGLVSKIPANAKALMHAFWPGPLTVVLERSGCVPDAVTAGLDTVAIRLPSSLVARRLIQTAGVPIAAPSANASGRPSPTTAQAVYDDLAGKIDLILDGGPCDVGLESTVVDCTTPVPTLLRPGGVTAEMLIEVLGDLETDRNLTDPALIPRSPGMKYTHYAPAAPMTLIASEFPERLFLLLSQIETALSMGKSVGVVCSTETAAQLPACVRAAVYGPQDDKLQIAGNLYECLRSFDRNPVDLIFAEAVDESGVGLAIMNRLRKAAGYRIIRK